MNLERLCFHLSKRRRMYLIDDRFATLVAFVEGCDFGLGGVVIPGFGDWVSRKVGFSGSGIHWSRVIIFSSLGRADSGEVDFSLLTPEENDLLVRDAISLLNAYADYLKGI